MNPDLQISTYICNCLCTLQAWIQRIQQKKLRNWRFWHYLEIFSNYKFLPILIDFDIFERFVSKTLHLQLPLQPWIQQKKLRKLAEVAEKVPEIRLWGYLIMDYGLIHPELQMVFLFHIHFFGRQNDPQRLSHPSIPLY